ncbi:hypothetical protein RND81_13G075800 [Saponaria officinalis]|uniref:Transposase n=1 Tax=Saponaria officinalis TaxID=3572 RepID=A0AAW1H3K1_SAPOF
MRGPNLRDDERVKIVTILFESLAKGKPKYGKITELASEFQLNRKTITELWNKAKKQPQEGVPVNVNSLIPGKTGPERLICPLQEISELATTIGHTPSTVERWIRKWLIRSHSSAVHPELTQDNMYLRLHFVRGKLYFDKIINCLKFKDMNNIIHIDEQWFNMTKATQKYYLVKGGDVPYRSCKSKRFIVKIMFIAAVSRPIYSENGDVLFDGKVGIFPFTFKEPAKRNSRNRVANTMVTKSIVCINRINIVVQQDNAKPHISNNDPEFVQAATSDGFNIQLQQQPANSPDLNVLDLGFFRSIQSLQYSRAAKTVDELVMNVQQVYENVKIDSLDNVWLSFQACMVEIMKRRDQNDYSLPHLKKAAARRAGTLPRDLTISEDLVAECMQFLITISKDGDLEDIMADLSGQQQ